MENGIRLGFPIVAHGVDPVVVDEGVLLKELSAFTPAELLYILECHGACLRAPRLENALPVLHALRA